MTDMSLFGIHQELSSIINEIESLSPEEKGQEDELYQQLEQYQLDFHTKISQYARMKRFDLARIEMIDKEVERLKSVKKLLQNKMERFDNHALSIMNENGLTQAGKPGYGFRISQSNRVVVTNEDAVPAQFKKEVIRTSVMKQEIKGWLKETGEIPDGIEIESREYVVLNK